MLLFRSPEAEAVLSADDHQALRQALGDVWTQHFSDEDRGCISKRGRGPGASPVAELVSCGPRRSAVAGGAGPQPGDVARLPVIEVPTLVIWGEQDRALTTGRSCNGASTSMPRNLTYPRVPDGTHGSARPTGDHRAEIRAFMARS